MLNPCIIFGNKPSLSILENQVSGDIVWPKITSNRLIFFRTLRSNVQDRNSDYFDSERTKIYYWKNGVVPYFFDFEDEKKQDYILRAMDEIQNKTCIKYKVSHIEIYVI